MSVKKPIASVSLDLDNKWAYLKSAGNPKWESYPSYLDLVVPRILDFLAERELKITFFIVGRDASQQKNADALWSIAQAGHEIANHSFKHEPWLHLYTPEQLTDEFDMSEAAIMEATGATPVGFRGPGFSLSDQVLKQLIDRGYRYDASTFPTYLGPLARAFFFLKTGINSLQRKKRKALFGKLSDGFQSNKPYNWSQPDGESVLEIPVTTMPVFKLPIHASYLMYLSRFSTPLSKFYFSTALNMCRLFQVEPSFLLHPTDFLGNEDDEDMSFFPAMDLPAARKIDLLSNVMDKLTGKFDVVSMNEHATRSGAPQKRPERCITTATVGAPSKELVEVGN